MGKIMERVKSRRLELQGPYSRPSPVQSREGGGKRRPLIPLRAIPRCEVPNPAAEVPAKENRREWAGRKGSGKRETVRDTSSPGPSRGLSALSALCALSSAFCTQLSPPWAAMPSGVVVAWGDRSVLGALHNQSSHIRSAGHEGKRRWLEETWMRLTGARRSESKVPLLYTALHCNLSASDEEEKGTLPGTVRK